ncbi:NUDIX domain-containing protein [Rhizobium sp.]|jgi:8-oxo-dGTP diphosphatase|uniref:NUDIX domain-containing protein n=1 Tax=Rhizobium sp. TaxID=391 RepID=UPI000E852EAE|nr:DNA mismatch repair protein MutT [Rhizobium sp.]
MALNQGVDFIGVGSSLAILQNQKLLLYKRLKPLEAGFWSIVGGKVDHMEPAPSAARREAEEETGLKIGKVDFLTALERIHTSAKEHWILMIYKTTDFAGEPTLAEPDKLSDFGWFSLDDLPNPLSDVTKAILPFLR